MTQAVDMGKLEQFMGQMVGYMTGGAMCFGVWLGDELGLYRVLDRHRTGDRGRSGRQGRMQRPARPGMVGRAGRGRTRGVGREHRPLRAHAGGGDGPRRRQLTGVRRARHERIRVDVHRHVQDRRCVPGRRRALLGRPPPVPVLGNRVVLPHRLPGRAAQLDQRARRRQPRSSPPVAPSPTSAVDTARRSSCSPKRSRRPRSPASTSIRHPSKPPVPEPKKRA